ncbi:MAG: hypothetical protein VZQ55_09680, partial [Ruminococcus sp.]|nr:hypothetical protein [Ruminococcus sp.]
QALAVQPGERIQSAKDFADKLTAARKAIKPDKKKLQISKKLVVIIAAATAVTICAVVGIFSFVSFTGKDFNSQTVTVPDFTKYNIYSDEKIITQKLKKLNAELEKLGVNKISARLSQGQQVDKTTDSKYKNRDYNDIVDQDCKGECDADTLSTAGAITVKTIKPAEKYRLPDFCDGKTKVLRAIKWLNQRGFKDKNITINRVYNKAPKDIVLTQEPELKDQVSPDAKVRLTVSKGTKPKPTVPPTVATTPRRAAQTKPTTKAPQKLFPTLDMDDENSDDSGNSGGSGKKIDPKM